MKKFIISFMVALFMFPSFLMAEKDLNAEQLEIRSDLVNFLKVEGFFPSLDDDGDIKFKKEGKSYFFSISSVDTNPFYVSLFRIFDYPSEYSKATFVAATEELNRYKATKVVCFEKSFRVASEMYVKDSESIKEVFYKIIKNIDLLISDIIKECDKVGS